ncbi:MAG: PqqD family protein [Pseudomonadota bacterium]
MPAITLNSRITIPEDVLTRELDGELVLLHLGNERYYGLDDMGTRFWSALEATARERQPLASAHAELAAAFDVHPEQLATDLLELIESLAAEQIVSVEAIES